MHTKSVDAATASVQIAIYVFSCISCGFSIFGHSEMFDVEYFISEEKIRKIFSEAAFFAEFPEEELEGAGGG